MYFFLLLCTYEYANKKTFSYMQNTPCVFFLSYNMIIENYDDYDYQHHGKSHRVKWGIVNKMF